MMLAEMLAAGSMPTPGGRDQIPIEVGAANRALDAGAIRVS